MPQREKNRYAASQPSILYDMTSALWCCQLARGLTVSLTVWCVAHCCVVVWRVLQLISLFISGVSKLAIRQRVDARIEAATRQLKSGASQSTSSSSFLTTPLSPTDEAFLAQLDSYLQPPPGATVSTERFDASELLWLRGGGTGGGGVAVPAVFEPVVLHDHSASSDELVRQLLTPPPVVVEPPTVVVVAADAKGAKGKPMAAKDAKAAKSAKVT